MFWTLGAVVIAALAGTIAVRTSERSRAQLWRGSPLTAVIGFVSGILGSVTGNLLVFYGGNLAFLVGVMLAAVALMRRYEASQPSRIAVPQVIAKLAVVFFVLVLSGVVLWVRQTGDALLRVDSFGGAVAEVFFFALPSLVAFALIPRRWWGIAGSATVLAWFTIADWVVVFHLLGLDGKPRSGDHRVVYRSFTPRSWGFGVLGVPHGQRGHPGTAGRP